MSPPTLPSSPSLFRTLSYCYLCPRDVYLTRACCSCGLPLEVCNNCNCVLCHWTRVFHLPITLNNLLCESVRKTTSTSILCKLSCLFFLLPLPLIDRHLCFIYSLIPAGLVVWGRSLVLTTALARIITVIANIN